MEHSLLEAALHAQSENELQRANDLFRQHLQRDRNDTDGLAHYGMFCLQTGQYESACYYLAKAAHLLPGDPELVTQLGYAQLNNRNIEAAKQSFESALTLAPADPLALNGIGLCRMQAGEPRDALRAFEQAGIDRDNCQIMVNIADAHFQLGENRRSFEYFENARSITPHDPAVLLEYARCLRESGIPAHALLILDGLAPADRNAPLAILEAARCQRHAGNPAQAIALLEQLNQLLPDTAEYYEELGYCLPAHDSSGRHACWMGACTKLIDAQRYAQAGAMLDRMLAEDASNASTWNLKGIFHEAQQQHADAEAAFRKAIELDSNLLDAYPNLATLLEELNRVEDAAHIADMGLQLGSDFAGYSSNAHVELRLVSCRIARRKKRLQEALQHLDQLHGLEMTTNQQMIAAFERGLVLDRLDQPADAIAAFSAGNAQAQSRWVRANPGPNKFLVEVLDLLDLASQGWLDQWPGQQIEPAGLVSQAEPVFLVGFPRSGTTLLNQILESNTFVQTLEEKATVARSREIMFCMPEGYPRATPMCDDFDLGYLRAAYFDAVDKYCVRDPSLVLVDKLPLQIVRVPLIQRLFPRARFIFSARHPCDVCLSCFMQNFRHNDAMANFFSLAETVELYVRTMELWQIYQDKLSLSVHIVRYDDVVDDLEGQARKVCDFLGVPWQPSQADFAAHALRRGKIHTPSYEQVSQPIYRSALGRWENYREFFQPYLPALQPYIDRYG